MEQQYEVVVQNIVTNEVTTVSLPSLSEADAQIEALITLFRSLGWRKACTVSVAAQE